MAITLIPPKSETATHFIPYHLEIRNTHNSNTDPYASIGHGIHHDATTPSATDTGLAHNSTAVGTDDYLSTGFGHSHGIGSQIDTGNAHLTTSASKDSRSSRSIDDSKNDLGDAVPFTLNSAGTSTNSPDNIGPEFIPELQSQR